MLSVSRRIERTKKNVMRTEEIFVLEGVSKGAELAKDGAKVNRGGTSVDDFNHQTIVSINICVNETHGAFSCPRGRMERQG